MPQYSNSLDNGNGTTVNGVLNTESNTITYTVTSPDGKTATVTLPSSQDPQSTGPLNDLRGQFRALGVSAVTIAGFGALLNGVKFNTQKEADTAAAAATATGTSPPNNPDPPPPVPATSNPEPPAPPPQEPPTTVAKPPEVPPDEFGNLDQAIERQQASEPVLAEDGSVATGIARNTETGEVYYTDPPTPDTQEYDEFGNLDQAIRDQQTPDEFGDLDAAIAAQEGTGLTEPPVLSDEEVDAYLNNIQNPEAPAPTEQDVLAGPKGTSGASTNAQTSATQNDQTNQGTKADWRVRLSLAAGTTYLYNANPAGILAPLAATKGILFPYTPIINVNYAANYGSTELVHSNYKIFQYRNSSVDNITITCDFTAQDTFEANYILAVVHFLRSVTKMFYGQDENLSRGTPPPLCYLTGLGSFQFDQHPLAIQSFNYSLPNDVDYIRATTNTTLAGVNKAPQQNTNNAYNPTLNRLGGDASPGGGSPDPSFSKPPGGTIEPTYVPTKIQITIGAIPIVSRGDISDNFSVKEYATGALLRGYKNNTKVTKGVW